MKPSSLLGQISFVLFALTTLANLYAKVSHLFWLEQISKPLLMPLLMAYFFFETKNRSSVIFRLTSVALLFSWLGDIALLFHKQNSYFIIGLVCFLIAHVVYISVFRRSISYESTQSFRQKLFAGLPFIGVGVVFYGYLYEWLGFEMRIAVFAYTAIIMTMAYTAMQRSEYVSPNSAQWVYVGAFFFVISDGCLALDTFVYGLSIPQAGAVVMATYLIAQYAIVGGLLLEANEQE
jgi:uncharacterized membrane protein YhhN